MVHSNYKHFEGCCCPTIASNPAQADGAHPAAPAEHCGLAGSRAPLPQRTPTCLATPRPSIASWAMPGAPGRMNRCRANCWCWCWRAHEQHGGDRAARVCRVVGM